MNTLEENCHRVLKNAEKAIHDAYTQPFRVHHTMKHVNDMLEFLEQMNILDPMTEVAAYFHDFVCEPGATDNERKSADAFKAYAKGILKDSEIKTVERLIMATANPYQPKKLTFTERLFVKADWGMMPDWHTLNASRISFLNEWEDGIFKEYRKYPLKDYIEGRNKFLAKAMTNKMITDEIYTYLYMQLYRRYRVGIYAGSFNPFHVGHMDILNKADHLFDKVIIAKGQNPDKPKSDTNIHELFPYEETTEYDGMLVDFIIKNMSYNIDVTLIRGIRNGYDLQMESNFIQFLNGQMKQRKQNAVQVIYIPCDPSLAHVSSSAIRSLPENDRKPYMCLPMK